ncbi:MULTISPECIES: ribosomal protein S18-alanine N-acetyltransferase [unclassified Psychrobacillus]|uniref:ribosomal protein S18-alanine N-acetyltransferase n=1 Tax=unclassified Psychrobacillus TaxID=2636677 RepID=UPI00146EF07A|nr:MULTISPECIES: ribosomal protein S18-alanine N-acetyltransferase [unclassified Psychrobacillus]MCM3359049.1 ribosomal protein S18-alanine N-acetyltransferase [Psychrobacillus sp. MER TA 171]NME06753.1 ribosomal protein S18-alanine N-acetyltransferase [Psychrobacillus sp. BL-248-WT-3]
METKTITYRKMTIEDIDQVLLIEEEAFAHPWTREAFEHEMTTNLYSYYLVAEIEEKDIVGYCGMWIVMDESHITNVAVAERMRGHRIGEGLMREAIRIVKEQQGVLMTLEVRVSNTVAKNLYYKLGFQDGGIRKNYYTDTQEDALVMWVEFK